MAYPGYGGYGGFSGHMTGMAGPGGPMHAAPPGAYQTYSAYTGYPSAASVDPMWSYFTAIAGQDGEVDAEELQRCLTQSGIHGTYKPFSLETCRIMIAMLDRDMTGKMGFNEFKELWAALNGWKQNFMMYDQDRSGTVEPLELGQAVTSMGYRLSAQAITGIIKRYCKDGKTYFDDYVACCVKLRAVTDAFRRRDSLQQGYVNFGYDDFIQCTMSI